MYALSLFPEFDQPPPVKSRPKGAAGRSNTPVEKTPIPAPVVETGLRRPVGKVAAIWAEYGWKPQEGQFCQFNSGVGIDMESGQYRCISRPFGYIQMLNEVSGEALIYIPAHPQWKSYGHAFWTVPYRDLLPIMVDEDLFVESEHRSRLTKTYTGSFIWGRTPC